MFGKRYRQFSTLRQVESCIPGNEAEAVLSLETGKSPAYLVSTRQFSSRRGNCQLLGRGSPNPKVRGICKVFNKM